MGLVLGLQKHNQIKLTIFNSALQQGSVIKIEYLSNQRDPEAFQTHKHHVLEPKKLNATVVASMRLVLHFHKHKQIAQLTILNVGTTAAHSCLLLQLTTSVN